MSRATAARQLQCRRDSPRIGSLDNQGWRAQRGLQRMLSTLFGTSTFRCWSKSSTSRKHGMACWPATSPTSTRRATRPATCRRSCFREAQGSHRGQPCAADADLRLRQLRQLRHRRKSASSVSRVDRNFAAFDQVKDSMKSILRHDGVDVSMEKQVNEIVKNQQEHNLAISIMSAQFRLLRAAITERVA